MKINEVTIESLKELVREVANQGFIGGGSLYTTCQYCNADADGIRQKDVDHEKDCVWLKLEQFDKPKEPVRERRFCEHGDEKIGPECFGGSDYD